MKTCPMLLAAVLVVAEAAFSAETTEQTPVLRIQADQIVAPVSPIFSGMMTEEINHSYDGGLYAELIQNPSLNDNPTIPVHWTAMQSGGAAASIALDNSQAMNEQLTTCLRVDVAKASATALGGVANDGYWGIPVRPNTLYRATFYAKTTPRFNGSLTVALESSDASKTFARSTVEHLKAEWRKYSVTLTTPRGMAATADARFVLAVNAPGTLWFNLVSLFPPTWKHRANGNRPDVMQKLADMKPTFLRFPGGNYLEGSTIATRFPWKQTLGDLSQRPGHPGCWGYRSSDGLGLLEFLEWAEDLNAQPVLAVYAGYSLPPKNELVKPGPALAPYVADALDEIEYVIGDTKTTWGARRAADGHPVPFNLHYVEIGNEDWFDETGSYDARFSQFYDAIKAKYPRLQCISTVGNEQPEKKRVHSRTPDVLDEHYYRSAANFEQDAPAHFDKYDRNRPKIFVGEWAAYEDIVPWDSKSRSLPPTPTLKAALGDAAWLTAMERNSDLIIMQCYAPMLVNVNPGARQWRPNLIGYDGLNCYGSPSYYVIQMFNANQGQVVVKAELDPALPAGQPALNFSITKNTNDGALFAKLVNANSRPQPLEIDLAGVRRVNSRGSCIVLKSVRLEDGNSIAEPTKVAPITEKIAGLGRRFRQTLPPFSVSVLRIQTK